MSDMEKICEKNEHYSSRTLGEAIRRLLRIFKDNYFCVARHDQLIFKTPIIVMIIILLLTWKISIPVMIIAMFFDVKYSFSGKDNLTNANDHVQKLESAIDGFKNGYRNGVR